MATVTIPMSIVTIAHITSTVAPSVLTHVAAELSRTPDREQEHPAVHGVVTEDEQLGERDGHLDVVAVQVHPACRGGA